MDKLIFTLAVFAAAFSINAQKALNAAQVDPSVISVDGSELYEIHSDGPFLTADQVFKRVEPNLVDGNGAPIIAAATVEFRILHKAGANFYMDDLTFAGVSSTPTNVKGEVKSPNAIQPYLVANVLTVKGASRIDVLDLTGKLLVKVNDTESVDLSTLNKGIYLVSAVVDGKTATSKIVKK